MGTKGLPANRGSAVNGTGTRLAAAVKIGTAPAVNTADDKLDTTTFIAYGNQLLPIKVALAMGIVERDSAGAITERLGRGAVAW